jgi:hypothetical protein
LYPQVFKEIEQLEEMDRNDLLPSKSQRPVHFTGQYPARSQGNNKLFRLNEVYKCN